MIRPFTVHEIIMIFDENDGKHDHNYRRHYPKYS
jgi:hypothetical protein